MLLLDTSLTSVLVAESLVSGALMVDGGEAVVVGVETWVWV